MDIVEKKVVRIFRFIFRFSFVLIAYLLFISYCDLNDIEKLKNGYQDDSIKLTNQLNDCQEEIIITASFDYYVIKIMNKIQEMQPKLDPLINESITTSVIQYSKKFDIPVYIIISIIYRESSFDVWAKSSKGAVGLMQIIPSFHRDKMEELDVNGYELYHINNNIHIGCMILKEYFKSHSNMKRALDRYVGKKNSTTKYAQGVINDARNIKEDVHK